MTEEELEAFRSLANEDGEISKNDIIVQTKQSTFWKGNMELKNKLGTHATKVTQSQCTAYRGVHLESFLHVQPEIYLF